MQTATIQQRQNFWTGITFTILGSRPKKGQCQCCKKGDKDLIAFDLVSHGEDGSLQRANVTFEICKKCARKYTNEDQFIPYLGWHSLAHYLSSEYLSRFFLASYPAGNLIIEVFWETRVNHYSGKNQSDLIELTELTTNTKFEDWDFYPMWLHNPNISRFDTVTIHNNKQLAQLLNCFISN